MYTLADETFMDYALSAVHSHRRARGKIVNNNSPYLHLFKTDDELGYPELIGRLIFEWKDELIGILIYKKDKNHSSVAEGFFVSNTEDKRKLYYMRQLIDIIKGDFMHLYDGYAIELARKKYVTREDGKTYKQIFNKEYPMNRETTIFEDEPKPKSFLITEEHSINKLKDNIQLINQMKERDTVQIRLNTFSEDKNLKEWYKKIDAIDMTKSNGYAFIGNFCRNGVTEMQVGDVVIRKATKVAEDKHFGFVYTVTPDGLKGVYKGNWFDKEVFKEIKIQIFNLLKNINPYPDATYEEILEYGNKVLVSNVPTDNTQDTSNDNPDFDFGFSSSDDDIEMTEEIPF